ncbi:MAG: hypothetical protein ACK56F_05865, partial [bacterium]
VDTIGDAVTRDIGFGSSPVVKQDRKIGAIHQAALVIIGRAWIDVLDVCDACSAEVVREVGSRDDVVGCACVQRRREPSAAVAASALRADDVVGHDEWGRAERDVGARRSAESEPVGPGFGWGEGESVGGIDPAVAGVGALRDPRLVSGDRETVAADG